MEKEQLEYNLTHATIPAIELFTRIWGQPDRQSFVIREEHTRLLAELKDKGLVSPNGVEHGFTIWKCNEKVSNVLVQFLKEAIKL